MSNLKRLSLLTVVALAVVAYAAVPASADILSPGSGGSLYQGPVKGVNTGDDPTLVAGSITIVCTGALTEGTVDGDRTGVAPDPIVPASGELDFSWSGCTAQPSGQGCTVNPITDVSVDILEANAPSATIRNSETAGTTITCSGVFVCNASSNPSTTPVTAEVDQASQIATISDTVAVSGVLGCPLSGTGTWNAQYQITDDSDQDLDLWATNAS